jgi:hypothetical protein
MRLHATGRKPVDRDQPPPGGSSFVRERRRAGKRVRMLRASLCAVLIGSSF